MALRRLAKQLENMLFGAPRACINLHHLVSPGSIISTHTLRRDRMSNAHFLRNCIDRCGLAAADRPRNHQRMHVGAAPIRL